MIRALSSLFERYGAPTKVKEIQFDHEVLIELISTAEQIHITSWDAPNIQQHISKIGQLTQRVSPQLKKKINDIRQAYKNNGAVVVILGEPPQDSDLNSVKKQLLILLTALGLPFGAFQQKGFWQTLGVNPDAAGLRAESIGYIPLHIDFDQASSPPDGVALFCLRPDPMGRGESTLFDYQKFLKLLPEEKKHLLAKIEYSYSTLYKQNGIGEIYNPHPLLELNKNGRDFFRYNGKALPELSGHARELFTALEKHFLRYSTTLTLQAGDMLIVDQNRMLHGRQALARRNPETKIQPGDDRLLLQTYLRHHV